jgi:acetyl-CoA carboxylase biotin carboxyl carrier protein
MSDHALTEIMIRDGDSRILLRRGPTGAAAPVVHSAPLAFAPPPHAALPGAMMTPGSAPPPSATGAAETSSSTLLEIKAPMVGTFYAATDPESPPLVKPGSPVSPDTVVCIIEAMKVFNEIKAEASGTIERVLATNGGPVEYGQVLFLVRPH